MEGREGGGREERKEINKGRERGRRGRIDNKGGMKKGICTYMCVYVWMYE